MADEINSNPGSPNQQPAFSAEQLAALKSLIGESVSTAIGNAPAPTAQQAQGSGQQARASGQSLDGDGQQGDAPDQPGPSGQRDDPAAQREQGQGDPNAQEENRSATPADLEEPPGDDPDDYSSSDDEDPDKVQIDAFTRRWHLNNRGSDIASRFVIPARFAPFHPVGFQPETVVHYQTFCTGHVSVGREEESAGLYQTAAYTSIINNALNAALGEILSLGVLEAIPNDLKRPFSEALTKISDSQIAAFGTYELAASRYEVLCGRQGATGVADPELLSAYIDPPAAYSAAGRQAFRRQQRQAIKSAAQRAGRRAIGDAGRGSTGQGRGSQKSRGAVGSGRRGGRGGGTGGGKSNPGTAKAPKKVTF